MTHPVFSTRALVASGLILTAPALARADVFLGIDFPSTPSIDFPGFPTPTISLGSTITANVLVTGLNSIDLGAFDICLQFKPSVLQVQSVSPGSGLNLGNPADSLWTIHPSPTSVDVQEISFVGSYNLAQLQPNDVILFSVTFVGLANGVSPLTFAHDSQLSDPAGTDVVPASIFNASITVVPEPTSWGFASVAALVAFASWRRWSLRS